MGIIQVHWFMVLIYQERSWFILCSSRTCTCANWTRRRCSLGHGSIQRGCWAHCSPYWWSLRWLAPRRSWLGPNRCWIGCCRAVLTDNDGRDMQLTVKHRLVTASSLQKNLWFNTSYHEIYMMIQAIFPIFRTVNVQFDLKLYSFQFDHVSPVSEYIVKFISLLNIVWIIKFNIIIIPYLYYGIGNVTSFCNQLECACGAHTSAKQARMWYKYSCMVSVLHVGRWLIACSTVTI